jgi:hypothetical protein
VIYPAGWPPEPCSSEDRSGPADILRQSFASPCLRKLACVCKYGSKLSRKFGDSKDGAFGLGCHQSEDFALLKRLRKRIGKQGDNKEKTN